MVVIYVMYRLSVFSAGIKSKSSSVVCSHNLTRSALQTEVRVIPASVIRNAV